MKFRTTRSAAIFLASAAAAALVACGGRGGSEAAAGAPSAPDAARDIARWPSTDAPAALIDPGIEARIDEIMATMSVEQKVGQVIQADNSAVTPADVKKYRLGSVLSGGNSAPGGKQYATVAEWVAMADGYYDASVDAEGVEIAIPVLIGIDAVHGHNNVVGGTVFPHNIGLGAARDPALMRRIAEVTARELRTTGHDWTFAPTVAVPQDDRWGRTYEGFSEDPAVVASYAGEIVKGLQGELGAEDFLAAARVLSTAKHYLGDGGTQNGRDQGDAKAGEADFARIHAAGYPPAIEAGALSVMASFSSWQGEALHGHEYLLTDVLKERMGFEGFVVGDWNGHAKVKDCTATNCPAALNAGLDMYMAPDSWKGLYDNTLAQAKSGEISAERLDDAVRRILRAKLHFGLFDQGRPSERPHAGDASLLGAPEHRAVAREAVRKSLVLLKNNGGVLPLAPDQTVLVAGGGADDISKQSGGWTLTWQGGGLPKSEFPNGQSVYDGVRDAVAAAGGAAVLSADGAYDQRPDAAVVVFGENPYAEFQGDRDDLDFDDPDGDTLAIMRRLKADGVPVVAVFLSGRPMWTNPEINAADAFVAAWLPGTEGGGVADVLFSKPDGAVNFDFAGKLSFSWPKDAAGAPLNVGDENYDPLFAFGYGLTYGDDGDLAPLPEETGADAGAPGATGVYFADGKFAPSMEMRAGEGVSVRRMDRAAQEDAMELSFDDKGAAASIATDLAIDISREAAGGIELAVEMNVSSAGAGEVSIGMVCGEGCGGFVPATDAVNAAAGTGWRRLRVSLSCFKDAGADMAAVTSPFAIRSDGPLTVAVSDVRLVKGADAEACGIVD